MSLVGRAIGLFVLCVLVGMFLEAIGVSARGILNDTWHTLGAVFGRVRGLGVDEIQGYHVGRPVPAAQLPAAMGWQPRTDAPERAT